MQETTHVREEKSRPVGRLLRLITGILLIGMVALVLPDIPPQLMLWTGTVVVGLVVFYAALHLFLVKFAVNVNRYVGAILALSPAIAVFLLAGDAGEIGVTAYIGGSLLLDAITADLGCEVMALPGLLFGRRTTLCCLVFTPIDWVEGRVRSALGLD